MTYKITCEMCSEQFDAKQPNARVCSIECRRSKSKKVYGHNTKQLPSNFLGRLNEYKVMVDLGLRGFDVFVSAFPQQHYDLIIFDRKSGEMKKVEVKTGYQRENGAITVPKHRHSEWDIMAVVIQANNRIVYFDHNEKNLFEEKDAA